MNPFSGWIGLNIPNSLALFSSSPHLKRKMQDNEAVARGEENVSTPAEMVATMQQLYKGNPSQDVAEHCLNILKKPNSGPLKRAIPAGIPVASKPGGLERLRCDVGIVYLPRRPYAVSVMSAYSMAGPLQHERVLIGVFQVIHEVMVALDETTEFGRGL